MCSSLLFWGKMQLFSCFSENITFFLLFRASSFSVWWRWPAPRCCASAPPSSAPAAPARFRSFSWLVVEVLVEDFEVPSTRPRPRPDRLLWPEFSPSAPALPRRFDRCRSSRPPLRSRSQFSWSASSRPPLSRRLSDWPPPPPPLLSELASPSQLDPPTVRPMTPTRSPPPMRSALIRVCSFSRFLLNLAGSY